MKIINKKEFSAALAIYLVEAMDLDDVVDIAENYFKQRFNEYSDEILLEKAKNCCSFLLEDETLVEKEKPMYVDWSEPFTDIYPLTKQLHECLALGKWTEAEVIAYKLKNITSDIYGICVSNSVHSGVGFTEPYHYES
jgi:hypothetical protein